MISYVRLPEGISYYHPIIHPCWPIVKNHCLSPFSFNHLWGIEKNVPDELSQFLGIPHVQHTPIWRCPYGIWLPLVTSSSISRWDLLGISNFLKHPHFQTPPILYMFSLCVWLKYATRLGVVLAQQAVLGGSLGVIKSKITTRNCLVPVGYQNPVAGFHTWG